MKWEQKKMMIRNKASWESRHSDQRAASNADQVEFQALLHSSTNFESGIFDDRIADSLDDYEVVDPTNIDGWARDDAKIESATSDIGKEVLRRINILGPFYPFKKSNNKLEYQPSKTHAYELCLAISQSPSLIKGDFKRLPRAFERLSRDALRCFLGDGAGAIRTGWPRDDFEKRPVKFKDLIELINKEIGAQSDWSWCPQSHLPQDTSHKHLMDAGLDFLVWKLMPDKRDGHLFLLGQCACGDDWESKFKDLDKDRLSQWINPISASSFLRVFATPHHIPNDSYFTEVNTLAGLTLDCARITAIAESPSCCDYIIEQMKDPYKELANLVLKSS